MNRSTVVAGLGLALLAAAAPASADPDDLLPYCTSEQVPTAGECKPRPDAPVYDNVPGPNPELPMGLDPASPPLF